MDFFGLRPHHRHHQQGFIETYKAVPASFFGKEEVEKGNMIILPSSAARYILSQSSQNPMLFKITNQQLNISSNCGVLEFTAEEGYCLLPYWLMQHLGLSEGGDVLIESVTLPKGTFVKIQPHETAFIDLPNPKAVLENGLRNYLCLTKGDSIVIEFAKKRYGIDIIETRPANAIMTIQTDLQVDFAPPKDYKEEPVLKKEPSITFGKEEQKTRSGNKTITGYTLEGKKVEFTSGNKDDEEREYDPRQHRIPNGIKNAPVIVNPNYWDSMKGGRKLN
ncbi:hypothetical protein SteCoe_17004 [Stentor coeruleus]|uniref:Ubiquitin fusion degradation protein n=1 Tax=Stentor coeruleus TaxID=5963 RepID=A0A1R2BZX1_9CILI|nr:hypothetical protein SteCoe_17004 [Stentor coeruleus]